MIDKNSFFALKIQRIFRILHPDRNPTISFITPMFHPTIEFMKKPKLSLFLLSVLFLATSAAAQSGEHTGGGRFLKRVEYKYRNNHTQTVNGKECGMDNLDSKSKMEMLFFGDRNAEAEFFETQAQDHPVGFRLVRNPEDASYVLEVKRIPNYAEVQKKIGETYPTVGVTSALHEVMTDELAALIREHNALMQDKQNAAKWDLYEVETESVPVSDRFAERLYEKMVATIDGFRAKGRPEGILDGTTVTFRTVVDDEVRTLTIHEPRGDSASFADFCRSIVEAVEAGGFDEAAALKALKK